MDGYRVKKLSDIDVVSYGPQSDLRLLVGSDDGTTPIRVALQTCQPGYDVPFHSHPYVEYLIVLSGSAEFCIEGKDGLQRVELTEGEVVELHPQVWHSFNTSKSAVTRLLGIHTSDKRIVNYRSGVKTDARGFRVTDEPVASAAQAGRNDA